jgi:hypothetical protein
MSPKERIQYHDDCFLAGLSMPGWLIDWADNVAAEDDLEERQTKWLLQQADLHVLEGE